MPRNDPVAIPDLHDPKDLTHANIEAAINTKSAGYYVLGSLSESKVMAVSYVGRSDDDIAGKLRRHIGNFQAFAFAIAASPLQAYQGECKLYHALKPSKNVLHPIRRPTPEWSCPVCGR